MKAFRERHHVLFGMSLVMGVVGILWGLQAAMAGGTLDKSALRSELEVDSAFGDSLALQGGQGNPEIGHWQRSITAVTPDFTSLSQLGENGDGTAFAAVFTMLGPTQILGTVFPSYPNYEISVDLLPGQSGQSTGSGTGHFMIEDAFAFDFVTGMPFGPYDVMVDIAVDDATVNNASVNNGINTVFDPLTGEASIVRTHSVGIQTSGDFAGSLSISIDFGDGNGFVPVVDTTGGMGIVGLSNIHSREVIH